MAHQLHADDPMGEAAHAAAMMLLRLDVRLLGASSPNLDRPTRAENLRKALEQWPKLCRAMSKLQEVAPNVSREAEAADADMLDFIQRRAGEGR